jgi:transcriptional regulator with XRE-family HTH domain
MSPHHHTANPHLAAFGHLLSRQRIRKDLSMNALCKVTGISSSHMCYIESGRSRVGAPSMRLLAAVLNIADIEAWIVAVHGLPGPMDIQTARRVCELLQIPDQPTPNVVPMLAKLKPMLTCSRCKHTWRKKTKNVPNACPHCGTSKYADPWTTEQEERFQRARNASKSFWSKTTKPQRRRLMQPKNSKPRKAQS